MNHTLEQRELDAIRYNFDGRCFRLEIEEDVLTLADKGSANTHNWLIEQLTLIPVCILVLHILLNYIPFTPSQVLLRFCTAIIGLIICQHLHSRLFPSNSPLTFIFNRSQNTIVTDKGTVGSINEVGSVTAWQKGKNRFIVMLDFRNGRRIRVGNWCFSTKEFSWREDAQIIADFLNVPLQIPDVFEV